MVEQAGALLLNHIVFKSTEIIICVKKCYRCKIEKELVEFNKNKRRKDGLQSHCKECHRQIDKEYYLNNKDYHRKQVQKRREAAKTTLRVWYLEYLRKNPCVDCGESDTLVLEPDHIGSDKKFNVSYIVGRGLSLQTLKDELAKCEIVCANCHRRRTIKRMPKSYRLGV